MTRQPIQLSLAHMDIKTDAHLNDFHAPSFAPILSAIQELIAGNLQELYLFGNTGSGKTHLLSATHKAYLTSKQTAIFISLKDMLDTDSQALMGLETFNLIIIDDIHLIAYRRDWQEALFHLINKARRQNRQLIYTATTPPNELEFEILDLITRLSQTLTLALPDGSNPDDRRALLYAILHQKGWQLPETILEYLVEEGPHHVGDMLKVLHAIIPYVHYRGRKMPQKLLEEIKNAIKQQSLLVELADLDLDMPTDEPNPNLPMTYYF